MQRAGATPSGSRSPAHMRSIAAEPNTHCTKIASATSQVADRLTWSRCDRRSERPARDMARALKGGGTRWQTRQKASRRRVVLGQAVEMQPDMRRFGRGMGKRDGAAEGVARFRGAAELKEQRPLDPEEMEIPAEP